MAYQEAVARKLGANLKRERKRAGLSQEETAIRASLHRTEIGVLERGIRLPRVDTLIKLAGSIECEVSDLLDGFDWSPAIPSMGRFRVADHQDADKPDP